MSSFTFPKPERQSMSTARSSEASSSSESSATGLLAAYTEKVEVEDELPLQRPRRRCYSCPALSSRPVRVAVLTILVCLALAFALLPRGNAATSRPSVPHKTPRITYATPPVGVQLQELKHSLLPRPAGPNGEPSERRLLIVGAVNGRVAELNALLKVVDFRNSTDHLLLTGDFLPSPRRPSMSIAESLFSTKPQSARSVLAAVNTLNATTVLGPHEAHALSQIAKPAFVSATPASYQYAEVPRIVSTNQTYQKNADFASLQQLPLVLRLGRLGGPETPVTVLAHAGLVPGIPLEAQTASDVFALGTGAGFVRQVYGADDIGVPHMTGWRIAGPDEQGWTGSRPWWSVWGEVQEEVGAIDMGMGVREMSKVQEGQGETVGASVGVGVALGERQQVRVVYGAVSGDRKELREVRREKWSMGLGGGCGTEGGDGVGRGAKLSGLLIGGDGREEIVQVFCEAR